MINISKSGCEKALDIGSHDKSSNLRINLTKNTGFNDFFEIFAYLRKNHAIKESTASKISRPIMERCKLHDVR